MDKSRVGKLVDFIDDKQPDSVKELSRVVTAYGLWDIPNHYISRLINMREKCGWNDNVRDTARACMALYDVGIVFPDSERWLLGLQENGAWNDEVYDTAYALIALGDISEYNEKGCKWLIDNFNDDWGHVGTIALIITALIKQEAPEKDEMFAKFVDERAKWILSMRESDGGWKYNATSNLVMQALILAGYANEIEDSIEWLDSKIEEIIAEDEKKNIVPAALSMITLGMYFNEKK